MKRAVCSLVAAVGLFPLAHAQSLSEYIHLRKQYKIRQAADVEALDAFVGSRVVEVKGVVKGSFKFNGKYTILVERANASTLDIESANDLDWLTGGEVHARLLVKATRQEVGSEVKVQLLGAAPEQEIEPLDYKPPARKTHVATKNLGSRHSTSTTPPKEWNLPESQVAPIYANFIRKVNKKLSPNEAELIARGIIGFSLKYGVDARLIMAMVMVESSFDPNSTSHAGAQGLGQLMPGTAKWMGVTNSYDTVENLYGTVKLIRGHLDKYRLQTGSGYESLQLALAAYNAGEGAVKRHGGIPPYRDTQAYVKRVIRLYAEFSGAR